MSEDISRLKIGEAKRRWKENNVPLEEGSADGVGGLVDGREGRTSSSSCNSTFSPSDMPPLDLNSDYQRVNAKGDLVSLSCLLRWERRKGRKRGKSCTNFRR